MLDGDIRRLINELIAVVTRPLHAPKYGTTRNRASALRFDRSSFVLDTQSTSVTDTHQEQFLAGGTGPTVMGGELRARAGVRGGGWRERVCVVSMGRGVAG